MTTRFSRNLVLHRAFEVLERHGVPARTLVDAAGLSEKSVNHPGGLIPSGKLADAIEIGAELTGLKNFGLLWGLAADYRTFGALGVVVSHHTRFSGAMSEVGHYLDQMSTGFSYVLRHDSEHANLQFRIDIQSRRPPRHYVEGMLVMIARFGRLISNEEWSPSLVSFRHDQIGTKEQYSEAFGCPAMFGQKSDLMVTPRNEMEQPIAIEQTPVHDMIEQVLRGVGRSEERPLPDKVALLLPQLLPGGSATAAHVAELLNVSPRTLQRKLAEQGHTFKDLVNRKREEILKEQVRLGFASGENLAAALGFSQPSAASRFIRNYLGKTARELKFDVRRKRS